VARELAVKVGEVGRPLGAVLALGVLAAFYQLLPATQADTFVGVQPAVTVPRTSLRARGGAGGEIMEIIVTSQSTGERIRISIPGTTKISEIKKMGMDSLGFDFSWSKDSEWCISMVDSKQPADAMAGALDESKTADDYGVGKGDELHLWFKGM